jgi:hypothetical protein
MNAFERLSHHLPLFAEARGDIAVSFEFFPPKTEKMGEILWESIKTLEPLDPRFVSVTYGAGGSTRERTHATVERILKETALTPAAHLTCVGATRDEVDAVARDYWELGVRHIVALRGDPPEPGAKYAPLAGHPVLRTSCPASRGWSPRRSWRSGGWLRRSRPAGSQARSRRLCPRPPHRRGSGRSCRPKRRTG